MHVDDILMFLVSPSVAFENSKLSVQVLGTGFRDVLLDLDSTEWFSHA